MLPTQCIICACLVLSWSTTKYQQTKGVFQTQKYTNMNCTHKLFRILSKMCFLVFFALRENQVYKASMLSTFVSSSQFDALNCTVSGVRSSINKSGLFGKYFCFISQFSIAYVWLSKSKSWENSSYVTHAIVYRTVTFSAAFRNKSVGRLQSKGSGLDSDTKKWVGLDQKVDVFQVG